jgi:hypothetical protein
VSEEYEILQQRLSFLENEMSRHLAADGSDSSRELSQPSSFGVHIANKHAPPNSSNFPNAFFLDVDVFQEQKLKGPRPQLMVPDHVFAVIGDEMQIQSTIGAYFVSTFTWMGIVSKKKLYRDTPIPSIALEADVALLILCMKLINDKVGDQDPRTTLYSIAKDFYSAVELSGIGSIRLLQAGILITLYEMGHAIYPDAYLTIGRCGRVGQAIGLQDTGGIPQLALEPESWDDMEERRRVWWGCVYSRSVSSTRIAI